MSRYGIRSNDPEDKVGKPERGPGSKGHHCHALGCNAACPPRLLMCPGHWAMVPADLQAEVYRTVRLRGKFADATWAPWWRAAHRAMAAVRTQERPDLKEQIQKWLDHQLDTAAHLERKGT